MSKLVIGMFGSAVFAASVASAAPPTPPVVRISHDQFMQSSFNGVAKNDRSDADGGIAGGGSPLCDFDALAWHNQPAPGTGGGTLAPGAFFNPAIINADGDIAFFSEVSGSPRNQGIFVASASGVTAIVRGCGAFGGGNSTGTCGDPSPIGGTFSGFFSGTFFAPAFNDNGDVLFVADVFGGSAPRGLFLYTAATQQIIKIAAPGDPSPLGGTFAAVGPGSLNNNGAVVFLASPIGTTNSDIFMWQSGVVTKIAAVGDAAPGGAGTFELLGTESLGFADGTNIPVGPIPDLNDAGQIAFRAILAGGAGRGMIVRTAGVDQWYARSGDPTPAGGTYFDFWSPIINDSGQMAFMCDYQPSPGNFSGGWFVGSPGAGWREAISFTDPIDGGQCWGLAVSRNPMQPLADDGSLVLWVNVLLPGGAEVGRQMVSLPDGSQVITVRQGDPTPGGAIGGGTIGSMDSWPSMHDARGTISAGTPGASGGAFSAHMVWELCPTCNAADITGDCAVNVDDLVAVILAWGACPAPPATCPADLDNDGAVEVDDLVLVILNWGQ
jgi:hypothetical protein